MRLLDRVAYSHAPVILERNRSPGSRFEVTGASRFASQIKQCPLRFVLADDLTRASAELAFADGARLVGCLDLMRMPASQLWLEWNDEIHKRVIFDSQSADRFDDEAVGRRVGMLLTATKDGLGAVGRTFWVDAVGDENSEVTLSPLETHIDLRGGFAEADEGADSLSGGFMHITDLRDAAMSSLMQHVRFCFDDSWSTYYSAVATQAELKMQIIRESLAAVARDAPFMLAFMLLLSARDATRSLPISRIAINRKRMAKRRVPLLDHIEVSACLDAVGAAASDDEMVGRQSPRLHHVRGHLVRRDQRVFWRVPHLRGSASRGMVRSRTVCLAFSRTRDEVRV
jgi:hypothetical protein